MTGRVSLNTGGPLRLVFPSGQTYDLTVRDATGKVLYRWPDGRAFPLVVRTVDFPTGETSWPVLLLDLPGAATIDVELVTVGPRFAATVNW